MKYNQKKKDLKIALGAKDKKIDELQDRCNLLLGELGASINVSQNYHSKCDRLTQALMARSQD